MNNKQTLRTFCSKHNITIEEFSQITGVPCSSLYRIQDDRNANLRVNTIRKIYNGTKQHFGTPLDLWDYIDN
jgi:predicted transcriptional regulator